MLERGRAAGMEQDMLVGPWDSSVPRAGQTGLAGGRQSLNPSPSTASPLLCCPCRPGWAPAPGIRQHLIFREGLPGSVHPSCPRAAVSLMSLASGKRWCHGVHPEVPVTLQLLDSSLSYPPASLNPFHLLGPQPARGAAEAPGRVGSDTGVAVGWGQQHHPQQQWVSRQFPAPLAHSWRPVLSPAPPAPLLAPHIQGVAALCHQFLYIVHSLGLAHVPKLGDDLVEGVLHVPGHVPGVAANGEWE